MLWHVMSTFKRVVHIVASDICMCPNRWGFSGKSQMRVPKTKVTSKNHQLSKMRGRRKIFQKRGKGKPLSVRISVVAETAIGREIIKESSMDVNYNARTHQNIVCTRVKMYVIFVLFAFLLLFFRSRFSSIEQ